MNNKEIENNDKSFSDLYMDKRIERFGEDEIKARIELSKKITKTMIIGFFSFILSLFFPIASIYIPYAIIKIVVMYINYYRKSNFNMINKRKKGR